VIEKKKYYTYKGASVEVIAEVSLPCPRRFIRGILIETKAFLCRFEYLPYIREDGLCVWLSGLAVVNDPFNKLREWYERPLSWEWNDHELLSDSPEEAIAAKIKDMETLWKSSLRILCDFCKERGEPCRKKIESLNRILPVPISFELKCVEDARELEREKT